MELHNMQLNLAEMVAERTAELARSEAKYRSLVENALVGVFNSTLEGRLIFINDAMAGMFDFDTPEQMIAQGSLERWSDPKARKRMLVELQQHGRVTNFEAETITHTNRHIHVLFSARQIGNDIVGMVIDITERKQTEQKILEYQQRLKALASQLTIAEETERRRIATDLHDHVGQSLALARLQIASVRKLLSDPRQTDTLDEISGTLRQTVQETRDLIYDLSPPQLHEIGLSAAIGEWLEEHVEKRYKIKTECISSGPEKQLDKNLGAILFRNIRELVTNVIKHSHATQVKIRLLQDDNHVKIFVKDDGIGFDAGALSSSVKSDSSFGLFSIKERMADLGGSLEIVSVPGQGTEAIMHVPLDKKKD
jgi:PAS domain S-box-containing protein